MDLIVFPSIATASTFNSSIQSAVDIFSQITTLQTQAQNLLTQIELNMQLGENHLIQNYNTILQMCDNYVGIYDQIRHLFESTHSLLDLAEANIDDFIARFPSNTEGLIFYLNGFTYENI
jgi:phage-related protein